ncbi:MAG: carboxypeptidase regulatory-like domain-containing protein [Planctomycetes bacterium]|nr:carboxypeptidase regulatory-like domain-containing protein [Planctomycetota bacterium]
MAWRAWDSRRVTLAFARADAPAPALELTFFPDQFTFVAPSPPLPIATRQLAAGATATFAADAVPERAVVRYHGDGIGAGFVHVALGASPPPIVLRPAVALRGRVVAPVAAWQHGWRCLALAPVVGAEALLMGGGKHGVELGRAVSDASGAFVIDGVDAALDGLALRVRASGFVLAHADLERGADGTPAVTVVPLERGATRTGRVESPPGFDPSTLLVLARGLPGVQAQPASDGSFTLDCLPPRAEPRLVLAGLPPTLAHAPSRAVANAPATITLQPAAAVRGRVLSVADGKPLAGALVWVGDDDAVRADDNGCFELCRVLPGDVEVRAQWDGARKRSRRAKWHGSAAVRLVAGQTLADVEVIVTDS